MTNLVRRIVQLEQGTIGAGRIFVIKGPDGYDIGQAKSELGIQASNDDLVVYLREFSSDRLKPILLQFGPLGGQMQSGDQWAGRGHL